MNRTFNFQVDNGLFIAEYYLGKEYQDITLLDLSENIDLFTEKLYGYNEMSTLSYSSHLNTALTQGKGQERKNRIKSQLELLLNSIGEDKNCMVCGEKTVNTSIDLPYSSFMYGLASHNNFMNRGNNLKTVDVCPVCLFYSMLSFLNTQKISYPFVYLSDSDEFMREITERNQEEISKNIMVDIKQTEMAQNFIPIMSELMGSKEEGVYEDLNYISLVQYSNGKTNRYHETEIPMETLNFLLKLKDRGLIVEFYNLKLFSTIMRGQNLLSRISGVKEVSIKLYDMIKEEAMTKNEIQLIEGFAFKLMNHYGAEGVLKELKSTTSQRGFRELLIKYTNDIDLGLSLMEIDMFVQRYKEYTDYVRLAIQIEEKRNLKEEE